MSVDLGRRRVARATHVLRLTGVCAVALLLAHSAREREAEVAPLATGVFTTAPAGNSVLGYAGPSELRFRVDEEGKIHDVQLHRSADTASYVKRVQQSARFWETLEGRSVEQAAQWQPDAVSGATLTSRAVAGAMRARLREYASEQIVDEGDRELDLGAPYLRTVALPRAGYQGPTDAVLLFDSAGKSSELRILETFDHEEYLARIEADSGFRAQLLGLTLNQIAQFQAGYQGIEGVSGATMTSQSLVLAFREAAIRELATPPAANESTELEASNQFARAMSWGERAGWLCGGAAAFLLIGPLRRRRAWRQSLRVLVILGFGVAAGALLSLDAAYGWLRYGLPWKAAPLLAGFVIAAVLASAVLGRKLYCRSLCAHGAVQQLLAPRARKAVPPAWKARLRHAPGVLLFLAVFAAAIGMSDQLAMWEPFAAWVPSAASAFSLGLAVLSLVASSQVPLAYCHYGCPTGALLEYIRWRPTAPALRRADLALLFLIAVA